MRVLVVGANGQLGSRSCSTLLAAGHEVRGTVRSFDRAVALEGAGVEVVEADLTRAHGWQPASMVTVDSFLAAKAALPHQLPTVA